ncbi:hypothetical protein SteCoe_26209 [Stentor coeruleus]|uniref:Kinesin motor domain-containing protein n=1 Tax=Stentor coeruleus TaxID=5963 RepID=A0A1R2BDF6_9CILI|nr:hypothetical protein SteCoe_26209 [Stentor coeruleus]
MDRASLKLYCRGRGRLSDSSIKLSKDFHEISVEDPLGKDPTVTYDLYRVFIETPQEEVFEISTRPILENVQDGYDGLVIVYGPTGSGKSYTLFGREADKGIFYRVIQAALEESEKISSTKEIQILVTALELFGTNIRDLGLAYKDPHAINIFVSQQLEISELNGRVTIPNAFESHIKNVDDSISFAQSINDMRAALEAKQGKYVEKTHTIISIKLKQKFKGTSWDQFSESCIFLVELPGSEKPKQRKGQEFYESLNATSSFHAIAKCLSSLNSITHFSDHKITRILENSLRGSSMIALIGCVNVDKENNDETLRTLSYIDKCRPTSGITQFGDSTNADLTIKLLQDDRASLKDRLKRLELNQEEQLHKIVALLGVESEIDSLLQASAGSKDMQKLAAQREAVLKVDQLSKKNKELEKRAEENSKVLEKIKKLEFKKQEASLRQILEHKDELNKYLDFIEETKAAHDHNTKTQIETKTYELNEMLRNSEKLLEEKMKIMKKLPKNITGSMSFPDAQDVKELGKQEITKEFTIKLNEQERNIQHHFECVNKKFESQLQQRDDMMESVKKNYEEYKKNSDCEYEVIKKEIKLLFDVVKGQRHVINNIQSGIYNQHMSKIEFPESIIPEFPNEKTFPDLFAEIKLKPSASTVHQIKALKNDIKKSSLINNPALFYDIIELEETDSRKLVQQLRDLYKESVNEIEKIEEEENNAKIQLETTKTKLQQSIDEKFRFKELYINEIKKQNDMRSYINQQKTLKRSSTLNSRFKIS